MATNTDYVGIYMAEDMHWYHTFYFQILKIQMSFFGRLSFIIWDFSPLVQMTRTSIPEIDPASCLWMHNVIWLDHVGTSAPVGNKDQNDCPANQCSYVFI